MAKLDNLNEIRDVIRNNDNIVIVSGSEVMREAGMNGIRADHMVYEIEQKYGFSGEEIMTEQFLYRQSEVFYDYLRDIVLGESEPELFDTYKAVAKLEKSGKVSKIITRMVYDTYKRAGCQNVVKLYGSVEENVCPTCGKMFDSNYIRNSEGTPKCDECQVALRPGFSLFGEMLDNTRLTEACNAIENANVLIVLGTGIASSTWENMLRYYSGDKLIVINTEESVGDSAAKYRAYGNISEIFSYVSDYEG